MGLTTAMLTGFSGIQSNQVSIETIGDNVANVNTTAFKNQRAMFETQFYDTIREGSGPDENLGGVDPAQVGHGSQLAAIQRSFLQGAIQQTGVPSDLAVNGRGFFILSDGAGSQAYTRDGSFGLNTENVLVASNGAFVQGFAADDQGQIAEGELSNLTIPIGSTSSAVATTQAELDGNLNASGAVSASPAVSTSTPLSTATGAADGGTALTDLVDDVGASLFSDGDVITLRGVQRGGIELAPASFVVGADGSTVGDFAAFMESAMFINTDSSLPGSPGIAVSDGADGDAGSLVITSNIGETNAIEIDAADIRNETTGTLPFAFSTTPATGEGVTTAFLVNDSLGNPVEVRLRVALETRDETGTQWRFFAEAPNDPANGVLGTGLLSFDQTGQFVSATGTDISIDRTGSGAVNPLQVSLDFSTMTSLVREDGESTLVLAGQDGQPAGTLLNYGVDSDGIITGTYSNGATRVFGQVALARFANDEGLVGLAENLFLPGPNSGEAVVLAPGQEGVGDVSAGALEQSNVDLSREFIGLITASTGFSAAGRVVRTADDMLQELLLLVR